MSDLDHEIPLGIIADYLGSELREPGMEAFVRAIEWMRGEKRESIEAALVAIGGTLHGQGETAFGDQLFGLADEIRDRTRNAAIERVLQAHNNLHDPLLGMFPIRARNP